jgi:hypothetical protein
LLAAIRCWPAGRVGVRRCSEVSTMHEWLVAITNGTVLVIDAMVLVIIAVGTIQAFVQGLRVMLLPSATGHERRNAWLHYARWLVAGLTSSSPPISLRPQSLRASAPRDRRSDSNSAQLLPRERSLRGSQTAIRAFRQQVYFRMMHRRSGPQRCRPASRRRSGGTVRGTASLLLRVRK